LIPSGMPRPAMSPLNVQRSFSRNTAPDFGQAAQNLADEERAPLGLLGTYRDTDLTPESSADGDARRLAAPALRPSAGRRGRARSAGASTLPTADPSPRRRGVNAPFPPRRPAAPAGPQHAAPAQASRRDR
jgi:hypothetical protein